MIVGYIIGIVIWGVIWGYATKTVIRNKGYEESWFWWGFFFGFIALIVALTKPDIRNAQASARPNANNTPAGANSTADYHEQLQTRTVRSPIVVSIGEQYNGTSFAVGSRELVLGRDASCSIKFSKDTPGLSARHCSIRWDDDNELFVLKDLNSTYGTFLSNGEQLIPEKAYFLKIGESFYLGSRKTSFMVSEMK